MLLQKLHECWQRLPPGYRQLGDTTRSQPGDLRWLSDVRQWHEVTKAEEGKEPNEIYTFATPDKIKGAPPHYRPVKPGAIRKEGMLIWTKRSAILDGEWKTLHSIGMAIPAHMQIIEPTPPKGWEWVERHQDLREGDRLQQRDATRTETRWVPQEMWGQRPTVDYFYIRSTRHTYGNGKEERGYTEWGQF